MFTAHYNKFINCVEILSRGTKEKNVSCCLYEGIGVTIRISHNISENRSGRAFLLSSK